jgi:hypothetical protein
MNQLTINHEPDIVVIEGFRNEGKHSHRTFSGRWEVGC